MSNVNIGMNVELGQLISELRKSATKFKQNHTYNKEEYDKLLDKYAEALEVISRLEVDLTKEQSKMPDKEEIAAMGEMFGMLGTMNEKMPDLLKLKDTIEELESDEQRG
jgi:hypothetical protein